ncbi:succinylglutamate desuccinylase/aspartoacylase family protein [Microvirga mediterraneensis]|uniref:Succinylglutamate desuccinylase/aspartoacylase family protein n=1 Tax=Microvirga mediterraneensis TaxID=2754695 RepID=A0A838BIM6_9HYPH|nr:succinylglutamate desuccinylase/aspartoacylase family protein [Microvirga mediterraneensis]MBA1154813.1 succinylglutamate desuccinylase/aspartoacylase family protein [Microvirga mediterraneensis]
MKTEQIALSPLAPGVDLSLTVQRFGQEGVRPRIYVQASLHADEIPGMIAAHHLRERLTALEAEGRIKGEIVLVPAANPIGLAQRVMGDHIGRFHLADGVNFNRGYPHLVPKVAERVAGRLTQDGEANVRLIREALRAELAVWQPSNAAEVMKKALLGLAQEADIVLDLHCDSEAVVHLYTHTRSAEEFAPLSALLGSHAYLLADESGDEPFDEACSRPWAELADRFPDHPIPFACHSTTLEFRGERDVTHETGKADAAALVDYLVLRGAIAGEAPRVPEALCRPTPLAASEPLQAPENGILVFRAEIGAKVKEGDVLAEVIDPLTGAVTPAKAPTDGVMFARVAVRFATKGMRIAKVAGTKAKRTGKLLGA